MTVAPPFSSNLTVIKIGGGLTAIPHALDRVCTEVSKAAKEHRLVIIPGGGPFADAVREFAQRSTLSEAAAHWMAMLAMDQYAHVLAERIPGAVLVEEPAEASGLVCEGRAVVLAPSRWMRSADVLPRSWEVTSDSIAAFIAGALDARRLVLIKPATDAAVDGFFSSALPAGMPCVVLSCSSVEELGSKLSG